MNLEQVAKVRVRLVQKSAPKIAKTARKSDAFHI
jgi:hypothetical protein